MKNVWLLLLLTIGCLPLKAQVGTITHPWTGKHIGIIGDSVSDSIYCNPQDKRYYVWLSEWLGATTYSTSISGLEWTSVNMQLQNMQKKTGGRQLDVILVFLGTNDYNMGCPIGSFYQEETAQVWAATGEMKQLYTRGHRKLNMDDKSFCGRINAGISAIRKQYPEATIVLLTPLHRALFDAGDKNLQPDELYQNKCGEYLDAYVQKLREAAAIWSVYCIDLQEVAGMNPLFQEHACYFTGPKDKLHPNARGHEKLARTLLYQTLTMP